MQEELEAADYIRGSMTKPVIVFIAGASAPKGRKMGHAGAIISTEGESAAAKVTALRDSGALIAPTPSDIGATVAQAIGAH